MRLPVKHKKLACLLYISSIQYLLAQVIVGLKFSPGYSLKTNTISDLGNTFCGNYGSRLVCSPLHPLMNISFVVVGVTMALGSLFAYHSLTKSRLTLVGFTMFGLGGIGTILVGLFPENTVANLHVLGATLPFLIGNIGLILLGYSLKMSRWLQTYTALTGLLCLIALSLFMTHSYLGIGQGGLERIVAYPQTIWMIVIGLYGLKKHRPQKVI
jgi:hypothetical membrane protein